MVRFDELPLQGGGDPGGSHGFKERMGAVGIAVISLGIISIAVLSFT